MCMLLLFVVVDDDGWLKEERRTTRRTFRPVHTTCPHNAPNTNHKKNTHVSPQGIQERAHIFLKAHKKIRHAEANHKHER